MSDLIKELKNTAKKLNDLAKRLEQEIPPRLDEELISATLRPAKRKELREMFGKLVDPVPIEKLHEQMQEAGLCNTQQGCQQIVEKYMRTGDIYEHPKGHIQRLD